MSKVIYQNTISARDHDLNEEIGDRTIKLIDLECGIFMLTEEIDGKVAHQTMLDSLELEDLAFKFLKDRTNFTVYRYGR